jgi:hypothetical protein
MENLKKEVKQILEIVKECPENLQQTCFEILLRDFLDSQIRVEGKGKEVQSSTANKPHETPAAEKGAVNKTTLSGEASDLKFAELHVKAKKFMEKYKISIDQLNQLFYKENDQILPLFDDLKTTRSSESQIRVALLKALINALSTGEFQATTEDIRAECQARKCYDMNNFGGNFTNNASLFDFKKYTAKLKTVTLSEEGKKELSEVIEELQ